MNKFLNALLATLLIALSLPLYANKVVGKASGGAQPPRINAGAEDEEPTADQVAAYIDANAKRTRDSQSALTDYTDQKVQEAELLANVFQSDRAKKACLALTKCNQWVVKTAKEDSALRVHNVQITHSGLVTHKGKQIIKLINLRFEFNKVNSSGHRDFQLQNVPADDKRCIECKEFLQGKA